MSSASIFDRLERTNPYQSLRKAMNRGLVRFFERRVFFGRKDLLVAEVACGSGYAAHLISDLPQVRWSLAADISIEDFLQAKVNDFHAEFVLMDLFNPAIQRETFDLVWNSSSIEEISNPQEAVRNMASLVVKDGFVFVGVPNRHGPAGWLRNVMNDRSQEWLGKSYSRKELRYLMQQANLRVVAEIRYFGGVFIGALTQKV